MNFIDHAEILQVVQSLDIQKPVPKVKTACLGEVPVWLVLFIFQVQCQKGSQALYQGPFQLEDLNTVLLRKLTSPSSYGQALEAPIIDGRAPRVGFILIQSFIDLLAYTSTNASLKSWVRTYLFYVMKHPGVLQTWSEDAQYFSAPMRGKNLHPAVYQIIKLLQSISLNFDLEKVILLLVKMLCMQGKTLPFSEEAVKLGFTVTARMIHQRAWRIVQQNESANTYAATVQSLLPIVHLFLNKGIEVGSFDVPSEKDEELFAFILWLASAEMHFPYPEQNYFLAFLSSFNERLLSKKIVQNQSTEELDSVIFQTRDGAIPFFLKEHLNIPFLLWMLHARTLRPQYLAYLSHVLDKLPASFFETLIAGETPNDKPQRYADAFLSMLYSKVIKPNSTRAQYDFFLNYLSILNKHNQLEACLNESPLLKSSLTVFTALCLKEIAPGTYLNEEKIRWLEAVKHQFIWCSHVPDLLCGSQRAKGVLLFHLLDTLLSAKGEEKGVLERYWVTLLDAQPELAKFIITTKVNEKKQETHPLYQLTNYASTAEPGSPFDAHLASLYLIAPLSLLEQLHLIELLPSSLGKAYDALIRKLAPRHLSQFLNLFNPNIKASNRDVLARSLEALPYLPASIWSTEHDKSMFGFVKPTHCLMLIHALRLRKVKSEPVLEQLARILKQNPGAWLHSTATSANQNTWTPWMYLLDTFYYDAKHFTDKHIELLSDWIPMLPVSAWTQSLPHEGRAIEHPLRLLLGIIESRPHISNTPLLQALLECVPTWCWHQAGVGEQAEVTAYTLALLLYERETTDESRKGVLKAILDKAKPATGLSRLGFLSDNATAYLPAENTQGSPCIL